MNGPLRILHLEDEADYTDLVRTLFEKQGVAVELQRAASGAEFEAALGSGGYDAILADYSLPDSNGLEALRAARQKCPETPFLLVSGAIGEEAAIEGLKAGATDYVLKMRPERLVAAVQRAVQVARERAELRRIETELFRREKYFRTLTENALDILTIVNREGIYLYNSPSMKRVLGYEPKEMTGRNAFSLVHPEDLEPVARAFKNAVLNPSQTERLEFRFRHSDGSWRYLEAIGQSHLEDPAIGGVVVNSRDVSDRKQAEAVVRESEQQYRLIFDENPTPMWVFDQETLRFLEVNDAALRHYGYTREEFLGMGLSDLRPEKDGPGLIEYIHTLVSDQAPNRMDFAGVWRHRKKDGTLVDSEIRWSPIRFKGRAASLSMANDITERRRTEHRDAALSKLGQSLSSATSPAEAARIIERVTDSMFRWDTFTLDLYSAEDDLVYPILNVDSRRDGQRFDIPLSGGGKLPSERARRIIQRGAELILRENEPVISPDSNPIGDTSRASASIAVAPIRNRTKVIGILSIQSYQQRAYDAQDLSVLQTLADHCGGALERIRAETDRKLAEAALRSSERLFHSVWENSVDGMRLTDEDGTIVAVNEAFCRLVGMRREEMECESFTVYAPSEPAEAALEEYRKKFGAREVQRQVERRLDLRNGSAIVLEETDSFVELRGQTTMLLGLFRDVTQQKRLEDQLRQSQKLEAIGQLAGGVAHDFNNLLTVIHGHASLLRGSEDLAGPSARSVQQIAQAAERAAGLTRQLLTFGRRQIMQLRTLDLNEVVANVTRMLSRVLGENIALQLRYSSQPALVQADAGMMEQVVMNLAVNARDAMPGGGSLSITLSLEEAASVASAERCGMQARRFVRLSVRDTGCGIPPEHLPRIFEPFFTTKEIGKGTGLGLATVYGIVKQHQGWIEVESEVAKGSVFRLYLPSAGERVENTAETLPEEAAPRGAETILVVEDEAPVRDLVCNLLAGYGYTVLQAESGRKALELWQNARDKIDLLLTDLIMPDRVNGRELAETLRKERPELKVIFTSGYGEETVGADFGLVRGVNYLQKPYHPITLAQTVRQCLEARACA